MGNPATDLRLHVHRVLTDAFDRSGLTVDQLAARAGVSRPTVYRLLAGESYGMDSLERVSRVLRIDWRSRP